LKKLSDDTELDMDDRRKLDEALLELLGVKSKAERASILDELYGVLREHFELARRKEEQGIANRRTARRQGVVRPDTIAEELLGKIATQHPYLLRSYDFFLDKSKPYVTVDTPDDGEPESYNGLFEEFGVDFRKGRRSLRVVKLKNASQARLLLQLAQIGVRGLVRLPVDPKEADDVLRRVREHEDNVKSTIAALVDERTSDADINEAVQQILLASIRQERMHT
jgi:hypothetical protein